MRILMVTLHILKHVIFPCRCDGSVRFLSRLHDKQIDYEPIWPYFVAKNRIKITKLQNIFILQYIDLHVNAITLMIANDLTGNFSSSHKKDNHHLFAIENQQASNILLPKND